MRKSKWTTPSSYDEVFKRWGPVAFRLARQWGFGEEESRDFQAQVVEEFLLGSYLEIFDESKGAFSTFWYSFVVKRLKREGSRKKRDPLQYSSGLEWANEDGSSEERFESFTVVDPQRRVEVRESLQELIVALNAIPPKSSKRGKDGKFRTRSLAVLFNMLSKGWDRKEIAEYWGVTEGTVSYMVKELKLVPELLAFKVLVESTGLGD